VSPPVIPPQPIELTRGLCASGSWPSSWWTDSKDLKEREKARELCQICPVIETCRDYAVQLPTGWCVSIYAGLTPTALNKAKKQARAAAKAAAVPAGGARRNAAKAECDQGHQLSGHNLVRIRDARNGKLYRHCRECLNRANRASQARRRLLDREGINARKRARYAARKAAAAA
jgi:hypothetical protein